MFSREVLASLSHIGRHNMKYIKSITIEMYNPKDIYKGSLLYPTNYQASIHFLKDNVSFRKTINKNHLDDLVKEIKHTIDNEIKL